MAYKYKCKTCKASKQLMTKYRGITCPYCGGSMSFSGIVVTKQKKK